MGALTHVADIQKIALEKINHDLNNITFIMQSEASGLATDQAEQNEHIIKMELKMNELEIELVALEKVESDANFAAEHKNHGDVVINADYQKELGIRDGEYQKLMKRLKDFNKTLYAKQQIVS
jgi:hypothetical protein